jgi:hypothetical protein
MTHWIVKAALPLLAALATGCSTLETGPSPTESDASPVNFRLKNSDALSGTLNSTVPDDEPSGEQFF